MIQGWIEMDLILDFSFPNETQKLIQRVSKLLNMSHHDVLYDRDDATTWIHWNQVKILPPPVSEGVTMICTQSLNRDALESTPHECTFNLGFSTVCMCIF